MYALILHILSIYSFMEYLTKLSVAQVIHSVYRGRVRLSVNSELQNI
jgi:hypothetical protein